MTEAVRAGGNSTGKGRKRGDSLAYSPGKQIEKGQQTIADVWYFFAGYLLSVGPAEDLQ